MGEEYITYGEFVDRSRKGLTYEGYVVGWGYASVVYSNGIYYQNLKVTEEDTQKSYSELCDKIKSSITKNEIVEGKPVVLVNLGDGRYYIGGQSTKVDCKISADGKVEINLVNIKDSFPIFTGDLEKFSEKFLNNSRRPTADAIQISKEISLPLSVVSNLVSVYGVYRTADISFELKKIFKDVTFSAEKFNKSSQINVKWDYGKSTDYFANKNGITTNKGKSALNGCGKAATAQRAAYVSQELAPYQKALRNIHGIGTALNGLGIVVGGVEIYDCFSNPDSGFEERVRSVADFGVAVIVFAFPGLWWVGALYLAGTALCDYSQRKSVADMEFDAYYETLKSQYENGGPAKEPFRMKIRTTKWSPNAKFLFNSPYGNVYEEEVVYKPQKDLRYFLPDGTLVPLRSKEMERAFYFNKQNTYQFNPQK
ncbi:MAG: hypothetical protein IJ916_08900 [Paludibacteraceae bacterium]|nr:hypothetical protein [Paludibacteraceae bacterium]